eukprot:Seg1928.7 transcript_id=Seg1928.7/GoldUCD/mRNA.D3Y31 product="hypothetical protein" protein_id=Seg1928.7/GoldUCD/D3Y31
MSFAQMIQDGETKKFPVNGQGTFIYTRRFTGLNETGEFAIVVTPEKVKLGERPHEYIALHVTQKKASFEKMEKECGEEGNEKEGIGSEPKRLLSYWLSYDRDACTVKYGKGYRMVETTLLTHNFYKNESKGKPEKFFNAAKPIYVMVFLVGGSLAMKVPPLIEVESTFQFEENPLVSNYPPLVKDSDKVTLLDVDQNLFMFSSSLPLACKELYSNIRNTELEYPAHPNYPGIKLSDAIRYSLNTKGMMLANIIKTKQEKKKPDKKSEVYIRVTLGPDMRTGPGVAYVLELWPSKCRSPIHNHGAACAVIKVLYGQIQTKVFNKGSNPPTTKDFIKKFDAVKDDVTWMDSNWYQSHQLVNTTNDYCATIQCYKYAAGDTIHWPGFDFIAVGEQDQEHVLDTFIPNSDATFQKLRDTVLKEYHDHLAEKEQSSSSDDDDDCDDD